MEIEINSLSKNQLGKLIDALLECPSLKDKKKRGNVLEQLDKLIFNSIDDADSDRHYMYNILKTCNNYNSGLAQLIESVEFFDKNTKLFECVKFILKSIELQQKLAILLENTSIFKQKEWYNRSISHVPTPDKNLINDSLELKNLIENLADYPHSPNGSIPLITFSEGLIWQTSLNQNEKCKVREVINEFAEINYNVDKNYIEMIRENLQAELDPEQAKNKLAPSLMVLVREVGGRPHQYDVSIYKWEESNSTSGNLKGRQFLKGNSVLPTIGDVQEYVSAKLSEIVQSFPEGTPQPIIEFLLPYTLFHLDIDQWFIRKESIFNEDLIIGVEYPVVVRFAGYASQPRLKEAVSERWEIYHRSKPDILKKKICWADESINAQLIYNSISLEQQACLAFTFTVDHKKTELWVKALLAGIPVALWFRKEPSVSSCRRQYLERILHHESQQDIRELPSRILKKRQKAKTIQDKVLASNINNVTEFEELLGDCISLLWEDPNRFLVQEHARSPV